MSEKDKVFMSDGVHTIETTRFLMNIWERDGFEEVEAPEEVEVEKKAGRPRK